LLTELRQEQCAWLAKWQRHGGKCFVFVGIVSFDDLVGFHCITQAVWSDWLKANKLRYPATNVYTALDVMTWFREYTSA